MRQRILILTILLAATQSYGQGQQLSIVNVKGNIPMSNEESKIRDYYINGGNDVGLKKGQVLNVVRKITARDSSGTQSYGDMFIPVGEIKIIAVYEGAAVARESKIFSRDELPLTEQIGLMTGDQIDLKNLYAPTGKK